MHSLNPCLSPASLTSPLSPPVTRPRRPACDAPVDGANSSYKSGRLIRPVEGSLINSRLAIAKRAYFHCIFAQLLGKIMKNAKSKQWRESRNPTFDDNLFLHFRWTLKDRWRLRCIEMHDALRSLEKSVQFTRRSKNRPIGFTLLVSCSRVFERM